MSKLHKLVATTAIVSTIGFGLAQVADADTYTVKKGDTLWDIAINNGTTVDQLMQDNNLTSSLIFPGDKLTYSNTVQRVAQAKAEGYYTVALGDTLGKVASKFGTSVDKLVKLNNISNPHLIYVGEVIKINETAETKAEVSIPKASQTVAKATVVENSVNKTVVKVDEKATVAAPATKVETKAAATPAPATKVETKAVATPAPVAKVETKAAATPAPAAKVETKAAATPAPVAKVETKAAATPAPAAKVETKAAATPAPAAVAQETPKVTQTVAKTAAPAVTQAAAPAATATTQVASSSKGAAIYQAALAQLGKYQDCTMLVTNALKAVGINFHDWPAGYMSLGTVVPASQAQPGDLIYYANGGMGLAHIAVYAGNGQAVHGGWNGNQTVLNVANLGSGPVYIRVK